MKYRCLSCQIQAQWPCLFYWVLSMHYPHPAEYAWNSYQRCLSSPCETILMIWNTAESHTPCHKCIVANCHAAVTPEDYTYFSWCAVWIMVHTPLSIPMSDEFVFVLSMIQNTIAWNIPCHKHAVQLFSMLQLPLVTVYIVLGVWHRFWSTPR